MSGEIDADKEDLSALNSILHKYGSSSAASPCKNNQPDAVSASEIPSEALQPTKSFLQEIQERAQILSCQRERSVKHTLHSIVTRGEDTRTSSDLDDFVKLIKSVPLPYESQDTSQSFATELDTTSLSSYEGTGTPDYWDTAVLTAKSTFWDSEALSVGSGPTSSEETDTNSDTDSDASELNFTWELNTEFPDTDLRSLATVGATTPGEYFQLEELEVSAPTSGDTLESEYFQYSALHDNQSLAMDDGEPPIPLPEDPQQTQVVEDNNGIVILSDEEEIPAEDGELDMEVDYSKKSFKATLGDEKVLDTLIDELTDKQNASQLAQNEVVSGEETPNEPSDDGDWVLLPKSPSFESKPICMDEGIYNDGAQEDVIEEHQEKKIKVEEEEIKTVEEIIDPLMEKSKDEPEVEEEEEGETSEDDNDNSTPSEVSVDKKIEDDKDKEVDEYKKDVEDKEEGEEKDEDEKKDEDEEKEDDIVMLRPKPQGVQNVHRMQRYSHPEFALFDDEPEVEEEEEEETSEDDNDNSTPSEVSVDKKIEDDKDKEVDEYKKDDEDKEEGEEKDEDEKKDEDEEKEDDIVMLRPKPQGVQNVHRMQRYSHPEFALFDSTKLLDTEMLKARAKLGKQGSLAQRRKPTKRDNSKRITWMFGDPNATRQFREEDEETVRSHSKITRLTLEEEEEAPRKPRKPIGGIGSPILLMGMGGPSLLKKTPRKFPLEDSSRTELHRQDQPTTKKHEAPHILKLKPARQTLGARTTNQTQPPSWLTTPKLKSNSTDSVKKLNHEILSVQRGEAQKEESSMVPAWKTDAKKKLPSILPRSEDAPNSEGRTHKKTVPVPAWKQEILKKKKEAEATGTKKRFTMPPPVAKKPEPGSTPYTTMPQWQVDLAEKKNLRKKQEIVPSTTTEKETKHEPSKVPAWKKEASEREEKAREQRAKERKAREAKIKEIKEAEKKAKEEKAKEEKAKEEKTKNGESAPLMTPATHPIITKKDSSSSEEEKKDKPKLSTWKEKSKENALKNKDTENKTPGVFKKPLITPKPKLALSLQKQTTYNDDIPQWKKDLVKKRRTSDWRGRLRSASLDAKNPPSPTSKTTEDSNVFNDNKQEENSTRDNNMETKRHTICTITDLPVKLPRNPPSGKVPQWKMELEQKNRRLAQDLGNTDPVPDN